jgi:5-methylcytosine-specific restriction endonuclease McrA
MTSKVKNYRSTLPCLVCSESGENRVTWHHLKTRKSGGGDEDFNLMPLCQRCHTEVHTIGLKSFAKKYPSVSEWLISKQWGTCPLTNKWIHGVENERI